MSKTVNMEDVANNKFFDKDDLKKLNNEELIEKVLRLQSHNQQLKNIIAKKEISENQFLKQKKIFDFSKCPLQHVMFKVLYLGWNYHGFVTQEDTFKTIEHYLMEALLKCCLIQNRQSSNYHRCGRTDKGVSSYGQVISITVRASEPGRPCLQYCKMLNRLLPEDIRVIAWCPVREEMSARFDCTKRVYRYFFPKGNLDLKLMNEAAQLLVGTHDFRNFCKMDVENGVTNFVRCVNEVNIVEINDSQPGKLGYEMCRLEVKGQAFLWHQVRCIVSLLFLVGQKLEHPSIIRDLLDIDTHPKKPQYPLADPLGLNLFHTEFSELSWIFDELEVSQVCVLLQKQWTRQEIMATHLREMLIDLEKHLAQPIFDQPRLLVKQESKHYKPILSRQLCKSLEDKIEHLRKKHKTSVN